MASLRLTALNDIADTADQALQVIRTTSYLVHPPLLDEAGLASAARWYTERFSKRSGTQVKLDLPSGSERVPEDVEMVLFRVLQEASSTCIVIPELPASIFDWSEAGRS